MDYEEFKKDTLKLKASRHTEIKNSFGVYDIYKALRKNRWQNIGQPLKEHTFYSIIRRVHKLLAEEISLGHMITFPCRMGSLELRKLQSRVSVKNGKLKIGYPVDWQKTLKLWFTDEEAMKAKRRVYIETPYIYKVKYNKRKANYNNQVFYQFTLNRALKKKLKDHLKQGLDTAYEGF